MIWNSSHIDLSEVDLWLNHNILDPADIYVADLPMHYIGLVGAGPKGLFALIKFVEAYMMADSIEQVELHWFNSDKTFGTGPYFCKDIPPLFTLHDCIGNISCYCKETSERGLLKTVSLFDWLSEHSRSEDMPQRSDFCSRELFGHYLKDQLYAIIQQCPPSLHIKMLQATVDDADRRGDNFTLSTSKGALPFTYESVLIASGHSFSRDSYRDAQSNGSIIMEPYPLEKLDFIPARQEVAVQGIGLSFSDVALYLTEGRGGIFYKQDNEYKYLPSGFEPKLYPFSKRSLPTLPRGIFWEGNQFVPKIMDEVWMDRLRQLGRHLNFKEDILQDWNLECQIAFYEQFPDTNHFSDVEILHLIQNYDREQIFSINALIDPLAYSKVPPDSHYQEFVVDLSMYCLQHSKGGELKSPMGAAIGAFREGFYKIIQLHEEIGFDEESQILFLTEWMNYFGHISFGSTRDVNEKLFCLVKDGYINFLFSDTPNVEMADDQFIISNDYISKTFDYLIDSRLPKGDLNKNNNTLLSNLCSKGMISELRLNNCATGKIDLENGKARNAYPNSLLYFYGIPANGRSLFNEHLSPNLYDYARNWAQESVARISKKKYVNA